MNQPVKIVYLYMENVEQWKLIPDTNGFYEASDLGRIRRVPGVVSNGPNGSTKWIPSTILSEKEKRNGYMEVCVRPAPQVRRMIYVHRAVYSAFNGPIQPGFEIHHKDAVKSNNHLTNLELVTPAQNKYYNAITGKQGRTLTPETARKIRELRKSGLRICEISKLLSISHSAASHVAHNRVWRHVK